MTFHDLTSDSSLMMLGRRSGEEKVMRGSEKKSLCSRFPITRAVSFPLVSRFFPSSSFIRNSHFANVARAIKEEPERTHSAHANFFSLLLRFGGSDDRVLDDSATSLSTAVAWRGGVCFHRRYVLRRPLSLSLSLDVMLGYRQERSVFAKPEHHQILHHICLSSKTTFSI